MVADEGVKRGAEWLRSGARMLHQTCPRCSSPLFERRGEIWCPSCNERVLTLTEREIALRERRRSLLVSIEEAIQSRLSKVRRDIAEEGSPARLHLLTSSLYTLLASLEAIDRLRRRGDRA
ncbi:TPA: hypothetical protein EYP44_03965 [Candidatus Bathyarchaeota archaeon]|nr:hypothetical protein [Candidatus Bathyarchaeota archaeon]